MCPLIDAFLNEIVDLLKKRNQWTSFILKLESNWIILKTVENPFDNRPEFKLVQKPQSIIIIIIIIMQVNGSKFLFYCKNSSLSYVNVIDILCWDIHTHFHNSNGKGNGNGILFLERTFSDQWCIISKKRDEFHPSTKETPTATPSLNRPSPTPTTVFECQPRSIYTTF